MAFDDYAAWFKTLQNDICDTIEDIEFPYAIGMESHSGSTKEGWTQMHRTIHNGGIVEKGTVNFSKIVSEFDPNFAKEIPGWVLRNTIDIVQLV